MLLSILAFSVVIVYIETLVIERRIERGAVLMDHSLFEGLREGDQVVVGDDGGIHLPGCNSAAPPVHIETYRPNEEEEYLLCPDCIP